METINTFSDENIIAEIYDDNLNDLRKGVYGKFIKDNHDGTYTIDDGTRHVDMKIEGNYVLFCDTYKTFGLIPCQWAKALPIISIKDRRHEQLYFENRTQILDIDSIFKSPNYFKSMKDKVAEIVYVTPMEYMKLCAIGFDNSTIIRQIKMTDKELVKQYAHDILKGDLFPLINLIYYERGQMAQEGRHRAMAIQYLIDNDKIPKDTEIPVLIVTER